MTCPRAREVEQTLSPAQLRAFCDHAQQCDDCGKMLDQVADAYRVLRADVPPMTPSRRVELLARIEEQAEKPRFSLRWALIPATAVLAVILVASWPKAQRDEPQLIRGVASMGAVELAAGAYVAANQRALVEADAKIVFRDLVMETEQKSALSFEPGPELIAMQLEDGRVRFVMGPTARAGSFVVSTALARFEGIAARFTLDVNAERVELRVDTGQVRATPYDGEARLVSAGELAVVEKKKPELAAIAPPVEKSEPPPPRAKPRKKIETRIEAPKPEGEVSKTPPIPAQERLDEARKVVTRDAAKARDLAEGVLKENPAPALEIGALLVLADAHRRTGEWSAAASAYQRVAEHANGAPYAEEALLRRAQILSSRSTGEALAALDSAKQRFPRGALLPERAVLEARLCLKRSDPVSAAAAIERTGGDRTLAVLRARVEVAEALVSSSPARAKSLVAPVLESNVPDLIARAKMIELPGSGNR